MAIQTELDKTFQFILKRLMDTDKAPNYKEIATELGVSPEEGQRVLRKLFAIPQFTGWFYPNTDNIMSFAPFNIEPTVHRLTIGGEQKWYGQ